MTAPSKPDTTEVYLSRNLHALAKVFDPAKPICVLFGNAGAPRSVFRPTLLKHRINFVFVSSRATDWWQYPDLAEAEQRIRDFTAPFPRRVAYGDSMGGYGALLCSKAIDADLVLACSPQFTIRPGQPNGDTRWGHERARIENELGFPNDDMPGRLTRSGEVVILYDPRHFDRHHVALIDAVRPTGKIHFPLAGHASVSRLAELGMLSRLLREAVSGTLRPDRFQADLHAARRTRKTAWLVEHLSSRGRPVATWLAERVVTTSDGPGRNALRTSLIALVAAERPDLLSRALTRLLVETDYSGAHLLIDCKKVARPLVAAGLHGPVVALLTRERAAAPEPSTSSFLAAAYLSHLAGESEAALDYAQTAADRLTAWDPENAAAAEFMDLIGRPDLARIHQDRVLVSDEADLAAFTAMASVAQRQQDWARAIEIWTEATARGIEPRRVAYHLAIALSKTRRFEEALATLRPLIDDASVAPAVWKLTGQCALGLQRPADAADAFRSAAAADPNDATTHRLLSETLHAIGEFAEARTHAERAQALKPSPGNQRHLEKMSAAAP